MKKAYVFLFSIILFFIQCILFSCKEQDLSETQTEVDSFEISKLEISEKNDFPLFSDLITNTIVYENSVKNIRPVSKEELSCNEKEISPLFPKMIEIRDEKNNLNIEISETLVTMEEYKSYLVQTYSSQAENFEGWEQEWLSVEFQNDLPMCFLSWREAADYCNWLSEENGLQPVYSYNYNDEPEINKTANGYRFPYIKEMLILSGLNDGLSKEEYEEENTFEKKQLFPVHEGKKNRYGIYDLFGNLPQYCNDYYLKDYDYFNYEKNPYGPDEYTNDDEAGAFWVDGQMLYDESKKEPLLCAFGCYCFNASYNSVMKRVVLGTNTKDTLNSISIRVVRNMPTKI